MNEYKIGGIPVIDGNGILKGIVTNRDLRFENNQITEDHRGDDNKSDHNKSPDKS
jgi:CBS-domain-containing membrane protein